jgi:nucleoside-diphosphate-sugar epimerase
VGGHLARRLRDHGVEVVTTARRAEECSGTWKCDLADEGGIQRVVAGRAQVYNIASGRETPILAVAAKLCALAGLRRAADEGPRPSRSGVTRSRRDATRLRRAVNWSPE